MGQLVYVLFQKLLELEHDSGAPLGIDGRPDRKGRLGGLDGGAHLLGRRKSDPRLNLARIGIVDIAKPTARALDKTAIIEMMSKLLGHGRLDLGKRGLWNLAHPYSTGGTVHAAETRGQSFHTAGREMLSLEIDQTNNRSGQW